MKVLYSPQVSDFVVTHSINGEVITSLVDGVEDITDLSSLPTDSVAVIATTLNPAPVISAKRDESGELWVELYTPIKMRASEEERNPDWIDYNG